MKLTGLLLCSVVFGGQSPDSREAEAIYGRMLEIEKQQADERARYGFAERVTNWDFDSKGKQRREKPRVSRFENIFVEGALYRRLVERDGRPLSEGDQKKQDEAQARAAKQRREARRSGGKFFPGSRYMGIGGLKELAEKLELRIEGEAEIGGKRVWIVAGEPKAGLENVAATKEIASYRQKFWIARETWELVQRWAQVTRAGVDLLPGSEVTFSYGAPKEGMPSFELRRQIDFKTKVFGVATAGGKQVHEYDSFRRYDVESTITFEEAK